MSRLDFGGRVAIVTGGGSGMGREHAILLASRGARVVVNDVFPEGATATARRIAELGGTAAVSVADVANEAAQPVEVAADTFGQLDILVNNAGIARFGLFWEMDRDQWWRVFDTSLRGTVEMTRHAWPHLARSTSGRVINVSSSGMLGSPLASAYAAAKAAIWGFGNALQLEAKDTTVQVTTVQPTAWTPMTESAFEDPAVRDAMSSKMPAAGCAAFVAWLAHQDTTVHGECFQVSGDSAGSTAFAAFPRLRASAMTPEAWAELGSTLRRPTGALTPLRTTHESFRAELVLAEPSLDAVLPAEVAKVTRRGRSPTT